MRISQFTMNIYHNDELKYVRVEIRTFKTDRKVINSKLYLKILQIIKYTKYT